jgi:hypothetical protein
MADYSNARVKFIKAPPPAVQQDGVYLTDLMETEIETYILGIDSTTFPVISVTPWRDGVLVISAS